MIIRIYKKSDCAQIVNLFYNTVHSVCKKDYTCEQLNAWAPKIPDEKVWNEVFESSHTLVAEINGSIAGFGNIDKDYLDRLYVHKDYLKLGIGLQIVENLEKHALQNGYGKITTHASITALPFFERLGYTVQTRQTVVRGGTSLTNYVMCKIIK